MIVKIHQYEKMHNVNFLDAFLVECLCGYRHRLINTAYIVNKLLEKHCGCGAPFFQYHPDYDTAVVLGDGLIELQDALRIAELIGDGQRVAQIDEYCTD